MENNENLQNNEKLQNLQNLNIDELEMIKNSFVSNRKQEMILVNRLLKFKNRNIKFNPNQVKFVRAVNNKRRFSPDVGLKTIFLLLDSNLIIEILKELLGMEFDDDMKITPLNTEHYHVFGKNHKSHVRGDLAFKISGINGKEEITVVIELQSTKDSTMGFRMFVYSLNMADEQALDGKKVYVFPKGLTIYTTNEIKSAEGFDDVYFKIDNFGVEESGTQINKYTSKENDLLKVSFPYKNLFKMELDDICGSALYVFSAVYLYKYRKNPELIHGMDVVGILSKIDKAVEKYEGKNKAALEKITSDCILDFKDVLISDRKQFKREIEKMNFVTKSPTDILIERAIRKTEVKLKQAEEKAKQAEEKAKQAEEKAKQAKQAEEKVKQEKINMVIKFINKGLSDDEIMDYSNLTLDEIEEIRNQNSN